MTRIACFIALGAALTACGNPKTTGYGTPSAPPSGERESVQTKASHASQPGAEPSASDEGGARASAEYAPPASAPMDARADGYAPPAPEPSRPGLGTEWGETRASRVSTAPFERADWSSPSAVATLYYNDAEGVRAMTRGASLGSFSSGGAGVRGGALTVRLLDASGAPLPTFDFGARTYVMGDAGARYVIQIQNDTPQRFEAVATVDGLDVMDGKPGSFEKRGYLVAPWSTTRIEGFRRSYDEVAAFRFGAVSDSYAAKKGDARNVGVIGVAFFAERGARDPWLEDEARRRHGADPFPGRFATPP